MKGLNRGFKMAEMFFSIMIFGLHAASTIWWGSVTVGSWRIISVISATTLCSPVIPVMFRVEPYLYNSQELPKQIDMFIIIYGLVSYVAGAIVILVDAIESRSGSHTKDVAVWSIICSFILALIFLLDLIFTLKKKK